MEVIMKIKTFDKKLILNKKTITSLNNTGMDSVKGGVYTSRCPTWETSGCPGFEPCWTHWPYYC
jgi:hypothetical protein